jgi:hypothetical protein
MKEFEPTTPLDALSDVERSTGARTDHLLGAVTLETATSHYDDDAANKEQLPTTD